MWEYEQNRWINVLSVLSSFYIIFSASGTRNIALQSNDIVKCNCCSDCWYTVGFSTMLSISTFVFSMKIIDEDQLCEKSVCLSGGFWSNDIIVMFIEDIVQ